VKYHSSIARITQSPAVDVDESGTETEEGG
jgi:hypothetical protein